MHLFTALSKPTVVALAVVASLQSTAAAAASTLTDADRAEITQLIARYARALSACAADEYAELFVPDGVFTSDDFRGAKHREIYGSRGGRIEGRAGLKRLVETEDFCLEGSARTARANATSQPPTPVIEPSAEGATGRVALGSGGRYEDVYVKTPSGWRFKSRTVFMPPVSGTASAPATPPR